MKTVIRKFGSLFLMIGFFLISINSYSQNIKPTREEQKEAMKAAKLENFNVLDSLLNAKSFVLEANFLEDKYGNRIPVSPIVNFIRVNSKEGVLQTGSNWWTGYNGVGGVTAEGTIGKWKIIKNFKDLSYTIQFTIFTNIGIYDVFMTVNSDNRAWASITGLRPGKLIYDGYLETNYNSRVYKAQQLYY
jgi:hypothetical protein